MIDWRRAPLPFKHYEGGLRIPLAKQSGAEYRGLHRLLLFSAAYIAVHRAIPPLNSARAVRTVASGGGLHPTEVYLLTRTGDLFHYNPSVHVLTSLKADCNLQFGLWRALSLEGQDTPCTFALVVTVMFARSYFKYADFSYLLSATDAGVVLGRLHRLARLEFGAVTVHFDFDDSEMNDLLGVDGEEESAYVALLVGNAKETERCPPLVTQAFGLARARPNERGVKRSAAFDDLHRSIVQGADLHPRKRLTADNEGTNDAARLAELCRAIPRRRSLGHRFSGRSVPFGLVNEIVRDAAASITDLFAVSADTDLPTLDLFVTTLHISDAPTGLYRFDAETLSLVAIAEGYQGAALQAAQRSENINVDQAAFVVHGVSERDLRRSARANRAYRMQQMIAGAAMDYLMLASCTRRLVAHPVLGFRAAAIDEIYGLERSDRGSVAQVCVGTVDGATGIVCPIAF